VEGEVRVDHTGGVVVLPHRPEGIVQRVQVGAGAAHCRQRSPGRLDDPPHLGQLPQQRRRRLVVDLPAQHVGVQHVPLLAGRDERAALLPRTHQPLCGQDLQRLPQHRAADPQLGLDGGQLESGARRQPPAHDAGAELVHDLAVQPAVAVAGHAESFTMLQPPSTTIDAPVT
jgi:hypothetical protein